MGQKVNPTSFRLNIKDTWRSRWFAKGSQYRKLLKEDILLRESLMKRLKLAGVNRVDIERSLRNLRIILHVTRPGIVIGRGGTGMEELKKFIVRILEFPIKGNSPKIDIVVEETKNPDLSAYLVASRIAEQLERRMPHRRVVTKTMDRIIQSGAFGVKVVLSGRIGGAEISRTEKFHLGTIPLQTMRANIDYASVPSLTRSGFIGVKTWIYKEG